MGCTIQCLKCALRIQNISISPIGHSWVSPPKNIKTFSVYNFFTKLKYTRHSSSHCDKLRHDQVNIPQLNMSVLDGYENDI